MAGRSKHLRNVTEFELLAKTILAEPYYNYYALSSGEGQTLEDSRKAFQRYRFHPQVLNDVSRRNLSTTVLGHHISMPICISPTGLHRCANSDAERATAKGAAAMGTLMVQSSFSNEYFSNVAAVAPEGLRWVQVYIFKNRRVTKHLITEAEKAGYKAVVLTVDSPVSGFRVDDIARDLTCFRQEEFRYVNMELPSEEDQQESRRKGDMFLIRHFGKDMDASVTWADIKWIRSITSLPIVCKGVLTAKSARQAADAGVDAIFVSAHGGRQLDGAPAPVDALGEVVEAVRGRNIEVYMDGGVQTGSDVLKALARGARAVFVGRPILWGLTCDGAAGVKRVLEILRDELEYSMGLCGCSDVTHIPEDVVVHESYYYAKSKL